MKLNRGQSFKKQAKGFTLVELAIVLVIAGIILAGVLKGTDSINKAKVQRMVSDIKGLQATLQEFQKRTGRYAGDCDNNGVLNNATLPLSATLLPTFANTTGTTLVLDGLEADRQLPTVAVGNTVAATYVPMATCALSTNLEGDINLVWNELRRAGVVDANRLPRELAKHAMGDVFAIGSMTDNSVAGQPQMAGVIVVYGIPVWMAEAIDAELDGAATNYGAAAGVTTASGATNQGPASTGRVRLWAGTVTTPPVVAGTTLLPHQYAATATTASYDQGANDRDRLVAISYQWTTEKLKY